MKVKRVKNVDKEVIISMSKTLRVARIALVKASTVLEALGHHQSDATQAGFALTDIFDAVQMIDGGGVE